MVTLKSFDKVQNINIIIQILCYDIWTSHTMLLKYIDVAKHKSWAPDYIIWPKGKKKDNFAFLVPETQQLIDCEHVASLFFPVKY